MNNKLFKRIIQDINCNQYNLEVLCSKFYTNDSFELLEYLTNTFIESIYEFVDDDTLSSLYHQFIYKITDECNDVEELQHISICMQKHIQAIRNELKPYNKKEKSKDDRYYRLSRLKNDFISNASYNDNKMFNIYETDIMKFIEYVIFEVKDIDALYNIISNHKEIVNIYSTDETSLVEIVIRYFIKEIDNLSKEDIEYYKRVITMIVIRDEFKLDYDELGDIFTELDYAKEKTSEDNIHHIDYITYLLNKYANKATHLNIQTKDININNIDDKRIDLTNLPTITIDYVKYAKHINMLYDDAFSIEELEDGTTYLYMHTPDVDIIIPKDDEFDSYLKGKIESCYSKDNKDPMIPYNISQKMSLKEGIKRPAITTRLHVDREGKIIGVDYFKSIIEVNQNLSKTQADQLIKEGSYTYNKELLQMYRICKNLRSARHESVKHKSKAGTIMDEYNIWSNLATAQLFNDEGIVFPYHNLEGVGDANRLVIAANDFLSNNTVDEETRGLAYSLGESKKRDYYSLINKGNILFNKMPYGNITNPLREYISLETNRLIKDILIDDQQNIPYWYERLSNDVAEISEGTSKVKELYKTI